mmetsp:Transcript_8432/g.21737  ORF Transcript_8432/g.21737 Transcript_8432/m.21737 type:complete len:414 (-) Transcript_8432:681-1922(-)
MELQSGLNCVAMCGFWRTWAILHPLNLFHMLKWFVFLIWSHLVSSKPKPNSDPIEASGNGSGNGSGSLTCIVTGASSGIGFAVAEAMATANENEMQLTFGSGALHLILLCRTESGAKLTKQRILDARERSSGGYANAATTLETFAVDLADPSSVMDFARYLDDACRPPVKVLVNNAGIYPGGEARHVLALEDTFGSNVFGHFLLAEHLLPRLLSSGGVVVNLASFSHRAATRREFTAWIDLQLKRASPLPAPSRDSRDGRCTMHPAQAYACSKLALVIMNEQMMLRVKSKSKSTTTANRQGIRFVSFDPGACETHITRHWPGVLMKVYTLVVKHLLSIMHQPHEVATAIVKQVRMGLATTTTKPAGSPAQLTVDHVYVFGKKGTVLETARLAKDADLAKHLMQCLDKLRKKIV